MIQDELFTAQVLDTILFELSYELPIVDAAAAISVKRGPQDLEFALSNIIHTKLLTDGVHELMPLQGAVVILVELLEGLQR